VARPRREFVMTWEFRMIRLSALALCLAASAALAQQPASDSFKRQFDAGDPAVKNPAVEYRSVFGNEPARQPDIAWPAANDEMSKLRGHAGHIREPEKAREAVGTEPSAARAPSPHHQH
jgi:hypothetical protein